MAVAVAAWRRRRYRVTRPRGRPKLVGAVVARLWPAAVDVRTSPRPHGKVVLLAAPLPLQVALAVDGDAGARALAVVRRQRRPLRPPQQRPTAQLRAEALLTCSPLGPRLRLLRQLQQLPQQRPWRLLRLCRAPHPLPSLFQPLEACQEAPGRSNSWAAARRGWGRVVVQLELCLPVALTRRHRRPCQVALTAGAPPPPFPLPRP